VLTVNGGTFDLGGNNQSVTGLSDGGVATGVITTSLGNGTLTVNNSTTFSGRITDNNGVNGASLALDLAGPGNAILSGSNSFSGGTTLSAGNLTVSNNYGLGLATGTSANAGLTFNNTGTSNVFFTSANPQVASLNNGASNTGADNIILGNTSGSGSSTTLFLGAGGSAQTQSVDTFSGAISDRTGTVATAIGNLEIINGGFVELAGIDTFTGTTIISGSGAQGVSVLVLGNSLALENSTLNYNNQGGGQFSFGTLAAATLGGLTGAAALNLGTSTAVALTIGNNNVSSVYTGNLSGLGSVVKVGTGTVQFGSGTSGGASYGGSTIVNLGTLIIGGDSDLTGSVDLTGTPASGGVGGPNGLTVQDNAVINSSTELFLSSDDNNAGGTTYAGPSTLLVTGTASVTAASMSVGNTSRVENGASVTINDSASLIINGNVALIDTEGSTASTTTWNLNGGVFQANSFSTALGTGGQVVNMYFDGGILQAGASDNAPTSEFLPVLGGLTANVMGSSSVANSGLVVNSNGFNITIGQPLVSGTTNDGGLTKMGGGILTLGTANTYTGPTNINGGELALANINSVADTSGITFGGGALQYSGTNTKDYSAKILNSTTPVAIDTNGHTVAFASTLASSNVGGLTVENSDPNVGSLTLTAAEAYSGPTLVQSGADLVLGAGGSTPAGSTVTVSGTGTLQALTGNGGIGGNVSLGSGATLSTVDGSIGGLTIGGVLTIGGASAANIDVEFNSNADTSDTITVSGGALNFGAGGGVINVTDLASSSPVTALQYTLISDSFGLGTDGFTLGQSSLLIGGTNYLLSLVNGGASEILKLTTASLNYYWTGKNSGSFNNIGNFAPTIAGTPADSGTTLTAASNVFLTATANVVNAPKTIDGNLTINSLSFTGTASGITLASGTATAPLTIAAEAQFADTDGTTYPIGTGIVVHSGAGANTISAPITLGNSQTWDINNASSNPLTVSGVIGGSGASLTKAGVGTLVLNNTETYTGGTIVTGGTLALGVNGALPSNSLTVSGTGTVDLTGHTQLLSSLSDGGVSTGVITSSTGAAILAMNNTTASSYGGAITDLNGTNGSSVALVLEGSSNVTLSGSSTYSGGTTVTSGNLTIANNYGLGSATATNANAGLTLNPGLSSTAEAIFTSANPNIAALNSGTNGTEIVSLGNATANTATTLKVGVSGDTSVFNGNIINSGTTAGTAAIGNLVVAGGSLTLNGSDSYSGTTVVAAGTLVLGNTNALTGSVVNYNNQGGTLSFGTLTGATFGGLEGAENLVLTNTTGAPVALTVQTMASTANYSGALSGSGSVIVSGSGGTQTFSGNNSYTGTTTLSPITTNTTIVTGTIGSAASPSGALTQTVGGTLDVTGGAIYVPSITSNSGAIINVSSGAILSSTGTLAINATNASTGPGLLYLTSGTVTANAVTVGRDGLNFGTTLPLTGGTADGIYITGGALNVATTLSIGAASNSSLNFRMDGGTVTVGGITTFTSSSGGRYSVMDLSGGTFTDQDTSGVGILEGATANTGMDLELLIRGTAVVNTPAITVGNATVTGGLITFNDFGGTTNIGAGGIVSSVPAGTAVVTVNIGSSGQTTSPTITASASWSSSVPMVLTNSVAATVPTFVTASGSNITLTGGLSGSGGLIAKGTGILTLGGINSYAGATTVTGTGGRLVVSGSLTGTASVGVATSANLEVDGSLSTAGTAVDISGRLSGIGTVNGATILSSGTLASGFSMGSTTAGTLTSLSSITFSGTNSTLSIRLGLTSGGTGDNDQLLMNSGTLTLDNTTLRLSVGAAEAGAAQGTLYAIVNGGASGTGSGTDVFGNALASGDAVTVGSQVFDVFYGVQGNSTTTPGSDIVVELVSVPEPGTWAEIIAGIGVLCIWQRRPRRRNA